MKRNILYSEANYAAIVRDDGYFVDKTSYIAELEKVRNPVFLRPRRFGKSLFCSILRYYYDLNYADRFDELFGHTWIGQNPTGQQNQCFVLFLNFSSIATGPTLQDIEESFKSKCNNIFNGLRAEYSTWLGSLPPLDKDKPVANNLSTLFGHMFSKNILQDPQRRS